MPKSRRHRGKHTLPGKKKKSRHSLEAIALPQKEAAPIKEPVVARPEVATPLPNINISAPNTPAPASTVVKPPGLLSELRRIGILAGIILAALILLALFWH